VFCHLIKIESNGFWYLDDSHTQQWTTLVWFYGENLHEIDFLDFEAYPSDYKLIL
jgi:hypothetical protein